MPKWLSSTLIVIGFLALIIVAILPRNIEVTVTTIVRDNVTHNTINHSGPVPAPPTPDADHEPPENED